MEIGEQDIFDAFRRALIVAAQNLIEAKYLYQNTEISLNEVAKLAKSAKDEYRTLCSAPGSLGRDSNYDLELEKTIESWKTSFWEFQLEELLSPQYPPDANKQESISVPLPTVRIPCANCDAILPPHNAGYQRIPLHLEPDSFRVGRRVIQVFRFPYECQSCRKEPVIFLVRRQDLKLTLCGRSQFQPLPVPKFIPEDFRNLYRNAIIAHRTGFTLAAILYLRVLIEQHMRTAARVEGRYDLSELGESYAKTLPEDFRSRFPSLKKACDDLSMSIHAADENSEVFTKTLADVEKHFDALRLFDF